MGWNFSPTGGSTFSLMKKWRKKSTGPPGGKFNVASAIRFLAYACAGPSNRRTAKFSCPRSCGVRMTIVVGMGNLVSNLPCFLVDLAKGIQSGTSNRDSFIFVFTAAELSDQANRQRKMYASLLLHKKGWLSTWISLLISVLLML